MAANERCEGVRDTVARGPHAAPGVVELVRGKLEEVAARAEWALGSEEGRANAWRDGADDGAEGAEGGDFFEEVARAIEQSLWNERRPEVGARAPAPWRRTP
jgi:hypothetical protein